MTIKKEIKILVLRGGALGDFLLTLPALSALRRRWPQAYIELAGYPRAARLALNAGLVNRVVSLDDAGMACFFSYRPSIPDRQAAYIKLFDLVISYLYDPDELLARNLALAGVRNYVKGDPMVKEVHAIEYLYKPLAELALFPVAKEFPVLPLVKGQTERGRVRLNGNDNVLLIHPGSGSDRKNWPLKHFVELARLAEQHCRLSPYFIFGEADEVVREMYSDSSVNWPVLENLTTEQIAEALSAGRIYAGNDSGITHLAAALGVPTVAVFGPSDDALWGPRGPRVMVVRASNSEMQQDPQNKDLYWPEVGAVFAELERLYK